MENGTFSVSHAAPQRRTPLDTDLRGYLESNSDILVRVEKPVSIDHIGALSAQSEQPILFENIVERPGFRLCDFSLSTVTFRRAN